MTQSDKADSADAPKSRLRTAATLILMRPGNQNGAPELLIVQRSSKMRFAGGAIVFPGGEVDPADFELAERAKVEGWHDLDLDEAAARIGAVRETLEETGLAVALSGIASGDAVKEARKSLHEGESFAAIVDRAGWRLHLGGLIPWARWRPPHDITHRFDTRFYIADAARLSADGWVDNSENEQLFWKSADGLIAMTRSGEAKALFPTRRNLERLAQFGSFDEAHDHALAHPVTIISPHIEKRADGDYLCIPNDIGYPICEEPISTAMRS